MSTNAGHHERSEGSRRCLALIRGVALAAFMSQASPAQTHACCTRADSARIDSVVVAEMHRLHAPGVSIAIAQHGRVVFSRAYGVRSIETKEPMTTGTLVRIGSITKTVTALAASALVEERKLDLDAPISRYARGLSPALGRLTMRQLLSHTAGLVNEAAGNGSHDPDALARRVKSWKNEKTFAPPGDVFSYSSPGFWLAGYVISEIAKSSYTDAVRRTVLTPLGMTRSVFEPTVAMTYPLALDHRAIRGSIVVLRPFPDDASTWPSGSLFSSADDLIRVGMALADSGRVDGRQVLAPSIVRRVSTREVATPGDDPTCGHGLGLSICKRKGEQALSHYGFRTGSGAVLSVVPSAKVAIVVLANGPGAIMRGAENVVLDLIWAGLMFDDFGDASVGVPVHRSVLGLYASGTDSITIFTRGDSTFFRYGRNPPQRVDGVTDGSIAVRSSNGDIEQFFFFTRGRRSGTQYLHDGLNAFPRVR